MIERVVIPPYDQYELSTFVINNGIVQIGHFGGYQNDEGKMLKTFEGQFNQTLINLENSLEKIDLDLKHILKLNVLLKDIKDFKKMHKVWVKYFEEGNYPVRSVTTSEFVNDKILVQVEGTAGY